MKNEKKKNDRELKRRGREERRRNVKKGRLIGVGWDGAPANRAPSNDPMVRIDRTYCAG